jgi:hypothetical protein
MAFGDLPEIGAAPSLEKYHAEVIKPGITVLLQQIQALALKVEVLSKEPKPIIVEVRIPENFTITVQRRDVL